MNLREVIGAVEQKMRPKETILLLLAKRGGKNGDRVSGEATKVATEPTVAQANACKCIKVSGSAKHGASR